MTTWFRDEMWSRDTVSARLDPLPSWVVPVASPLPAQFDRTFVDRNVALMLNGIDLAGEWRVDVAVFSPPGSDPIPDCGWLFVDGWSDVAAHSFGIRFSAEASARQVERVDFGPIQAAQELGNPFSSEVHVACVDEAWNIPCGIIAGVQPSRVSLGFGT